MNQPDLTPKQNHKAYQTCHISDEENVASIYQDYASAAEQKLELLYEHAFETDEKEESAKVLEQRCQFKFVINKLVDWGETHLNSQEEKANAREDILKFAANRYYLRHKA